GSGPAWAWEGGPNDRRPGPGSPLGPLAGAVRLPDPLEDLGQEDGVDPLPAVGDGDASHSVPPLEVDNDVATRRRELHRVRDEVRDHLLQAHRVTEHPTDQPVQPGLDVQVFGPDLVTEGIEGGPNDGGQINGASLDLEGAHDDARDIEEIADEACLGSDVALDHGQTVLQAPRLAGRAPEQTDPAEDRLERRAKLVGQHGQEFVLRAVGLGRLVVQTGVVEGDADLVGGDLDEADVGRVERGGDPAPQSPGNQGPTRDPDQGADE